MDDLKLWSQLNEAWLEIGKKYEPVVERAAQGKGMDLRTWSLLLAAWTFEPDDITPAHLIVRGPYTSPEAYLSRLVSAAQAGYLTEAEPGKFRLTERGRKLTLDLVALGREVMAGADPLSSTDAQFLRQLLERLVQSCLDTPPPPEIWSIQLSCKLMPPPEPPLPFIEQALSALAAYRDDAHLAAWQDTHLSATALETLTLLWNGEVNSLADLCKRLERRGHTCKVYSDVLEDLKAHGLINGSDQALWLTGAGRVFRNQIEDDTNRYFFAPWASLSQDERGDMARLFGQVIEGLKG